MRTTRLSDDQIQSLQGTDGADGVLVVDQNGMLRFIPYIYPTTQVQQHGFVWVGKGQYWETPVSRDAIRAVCQLFNVGFDLSVEAWLADEEMKSQVTFQDATELALAHSSSLFDFQIDCLRFLITNGKRGSGAILAIAPGLGKTVCAIRGAQALGKKQILVVTLLSMLYQWRTEIMKWGDVPPEDVQICHRERPNADVSWTITNWDTLRLKPPDANYDLIILDESVLMKNRKAQRTRAAMHLVKRHRGFTTAWLLSGAPITRFCDDLWTQFHVVDPRRFGSYWRFARRHCIVETNQWGTAVIANQPGAEDAIKTDYRDVYHSCTQDDVLDLPDFLFEDRSVLLGSEQDRMYTEMEERFIAWLSDNPNEFISAPNVLAQITRLVQLASSPSLVGGSDISAKADAFIDQLEFFKKPFVIWTLFVQTAQKILGLLQAKKLNSGLLIGDTPAEQRQQIVDRFQSDKLDAIVAHPGVGRFGLTLTKARTAIYIERSFSADFYYQSLFRVRRIGTEHSPVIVHLMACRDRNGVAMPTIDRTIHRVLRGRYNMVQRLTARDLLEEMRT